MTTSTDIAKAAKGCFTAEAWQSLFRQYGHEIAQATDPKILEDVFGALKGDPQSLLYNQSIWVTLLRGCLSSWNLELGREIAEFTKPIPSFDIRLLAAEILLEGGSPAEAREYAHKILRLTALQPWQKTQLRLLVCNSYVEEGKTTLASRHLKKIDQELSEFHFEPKQLAESFSSMARAEFFLGKYDFAANHFRLSYENYLTKAQLEEAAKAMFNAAACYHNSGPAQRELAFELIANCKALSEKHNLKGPLSHCYAFHGTDDYQRGHFKRAAQNYKRAFDLCPPTENSFRRLHITSMLALTNIRINKLSTAKKYDKITHELATNDQSERFRIRYASLAAEIKWQDALFRESQEILKDGTAPLNISGVNTLEELSALSRYKLQAALLNESKASSNTPIIAKQLTSSSTTWLELLYASAQSHLTAGDFAEASRAAEECYQEALLLRGIYYQSLALSALIQIKLTQRQVDHHLDLLLNELKQIAVDLKETDIPIRVTVLQAAVAYQRGDFELTKALLNKAARILPQSKPSRLLISCWQATVQGHSSKIASPELNQLITRATQTHFAPSIHIISESYIKVSQHYDVNLDRHPIIAKTLVFLSKQHNQTCHVDELRSQVWNQSINTRGWEQKIRNTIMRLRNLFPYTVAPLVTQVDNQIRLNTDTIELQTLATAQVAIDDEILVLLNNRPMSSAELAKKTSKSKATIKRAISKLAGQDKISALRSGRNILYTPQSHP